MRRVLLALFGTMIGTAILIGAKAHGGPAQPDTVAAAPLDPASTGTPADPATAPPSAGVPPVANPTGPVPGPGSPTSSPVHPTATAPAGGGPTTTTAPATRSYTGTAIAVKTAQSPTSKSSACGDCHDYTMSVTIKVSGGRITATSVAYNTSPGASQSYASRANSSLSQTILSKQTWSLGRVSGATYSGNAWEQSVRDAMAKAGLPV
jgi:uncharacterized protein with FMN-binding domain